MRLGLVLLAVVTVAGCAQPSRIVHPIDDGWRFARQDVAGAQEPNFDDSSWQRVDLPHTWNNSDGRDGGNDYYRGAGWYRLRLPIGSEYNGRRIFLRFGAATLVADVYVNGHKVGTHRGGFAAFCFDVTDRIKRGEENIVAVRLDNTKFPDLIAASGDFTIFGGLYREASILGLDPLHISPLDDGSEGIYLTQRKLDDTSASVDLTVRLRNDFAIEKDATLDFYLMNDRGKTMQKWSSNEHVPAGATIDAKTSFTIPNPRRWDGVRDPYMYDVEVRVRDGRRCSDGSGQSLGLRTFRLDPKLGFILNDKPYPLHGVNRHQDGGESGWAATFDEVHRDYQFIREMGCTAVRLAHYQHSAAEYGLCDRLGLVTWAELAMVNTPGNPPDSANLQQQLRELIKQNFNHPSICFWSLYNELSLRKNVAERDQRIVAELNQYAHELDPSRITVGASNLAAEQPLHAITDTVGFNRYFGWYSGGAADWPAELDKLHTSFPDKPFCISEYGAGASIKHHEANLTKGPDTKGPWHPEEWQAIVHERAWSALSERPWIWGSFLWCMFDFASDNRREGDHMGINDKGLVTLDRKTRKDAFYFYKANWNPQPMVYITGKRFNPRPVGAMEVKVYSNCQNVELFVNGKSLGSATGKNCVFIWPKVELHEGKNIVRAVSGSVSDECEWDRN